MTKRIPNKFAAHSGHPWTDRDVNALRRMAKLGTPTRIIGLMLCRSTASVRSKAWKELISLAWPKP